MATVLEMLTPPGVLCLGLLNLLNKYSSSQTLPCSRAALEASYFCPTGMPLCSDACGLSLLKCMAKVIKFCFSSQVSMPGDEGSGSLSTEMPLTTPCGLRYKLFLVPYSCQ